MFREKYYFLHDGAVIVRARRIVRRRTPSLDQTPPRCAERQGILAVDDTLLLGSVSHALCQ